MTTRYHFTLRSANAKTGPMPVTTTTADSCPTSCPLSGAGCYAQKGPLSWFWRRLETAAAGLEFGALLERIRALPENTLWRHNQAGDLPGDGDAIDASALAAIAGANVGKRGFTYTHKPVLGDGGTARRNRSAVAYARKVGFTVNLSADNLTEADAMVRLGISPVTVTVPHGVTRNFTTREGNHVLVCPAEKTGRAVRCVDCKLCAMPFRKSIVAFPIH